MRLAPVAQVNCLGLFFSVHFSAPFWLVPFLMGSLHQSEMALSRSGVICTVVKPISNQKEKASFPDVPNKIPEIESDRAIL